MRIDEQQAIRDRTAAIIFDWAADRTPPFTGERAEGFDEAILVAHLVADEARLSLQRWIAAARRAGVSWAEIGQTLGISKQAAQQRFGGAGEDGDPPAAPDEAIVRIGATAFNEMAMLHAEGAQGRELMRTGALTLVFRQTDTDWEYCRRIGLSPNVDAMCAAGWTHVSSWAPFHYYKRPATAG